MKRLLRAVALAFALSVLAPGSGSPAGTLTSPLLAGKGAGGANQMVRCFLTNVGKKPVQVESVAIREISAGDAVALSFDDCSEATLAPRRTCQFAIDPPSFGGFGEVTVKGSTRNLRGRCQLFTSDDEQVRSESDLR